MCCSNNDQTVKIYSLLQQNLIADLRHLFAMNYALISPDSETLVAVGDSDQAYFYRRKLVTSKNLSQGRFPRYDWKVLAKPKLARGDRTENDHSFSITFSPSGHLCAISAQGGMISVFDMDIFKRLGEDDDAESCGPVMLCSFTSSRSGVHGYVRSMAFSPAPWDLLVWAEDHGRAGIADVRQAFCRRQIIKLETHAPDLEKIDCEDLTDPYVKGLDIRGRLIHQYQENFHSQGGSAGTESLLGAPEDWSDGAALQRQESRRAELPDLDAREQSVLDTLEITMQEVDDAMTNVLHPYSVNYRPSPHLRPNVDDDERSPSRAHLETLIDVFRARNLQRVHGSDRQYQPRRRNSVVLSQGIGLGANGASRLTPGTGPRSRITASPARMLEADVEPDGSRLSTIIPTNNPTPAAGATDSHPQPYNILPPDPWHVAQSSHDPSTRPNSLPVASWLTPPNSQHDENDMADSGPAGHLSPPDNLSTDRTSAQTSTLPTTLNNTQAQTLLRLQSNQSLLRRAVPLSELDTERQIRRLASITADPESREGRIRPRTHTGDERHSRNLETRVQARQRMNVRDLEQPSITSATVARPSATQRSELSGRVTHADIRLARQMMMQTTRYMVDRNGNWLAGPTLERTSGHANSEGANGLGGSFDASEKGVGTAGVGWSADGRQL